MFYSAELPDGEACQNFSTFIEAIREHVKEEEGSAFGIPIMRAQVDVNSPERYMKVILMARGNRYTCYLGRSNLYIIGVNVDDTVYYFNREDTRTYLERDEDLQHRTLSFGGRYRHMLKFKIGLKVLDFALYNLDENPSGWNSAMLVVIQMISECARF